MNALGAHGNWYKLLSDSLEQSEGTFDSYPSEAVAYELREALDFLKNSCWLKEYAMLSWGTCKAERRRGTFFDCLFIGKLLYNLENRLKHAHAKPCRISGRWGESEEETESESYGDDTHIEFAEVPDTLRSSKASGGL